MPATPDTHRIGRILSLGFPLPGARVDNYAFFAAPSFFDYDAIVVDVAVLSSTIAAVIEGSAEAKTFAGRAVHVSAAGAGEVGLDDELARRSDETAQLLDRGGIVVAFAQPPATHPIPERGTGIDIYTWLPHEGQRLTRALAPADGAQAHVVDHQHPMAPFVLSQLANVTYHARIDVDEEPAFKRAIFARSHGGAVIGADAPLGEGRLVLLPALKALPAGSGRYTMSDTLQACIRRMLGVMAEGRAPAWTKTYEIPGLAERAQTVADAEKQVKEAQSTLQQATEARDDLAKYHALLWQEGALGLEPTVVDALRAIGVQVHAARPEELELRVNGQRVFLEIEGSADAVGMAPHYRLRQRIEREIERHATPPRGLLFVNGYRLKAPAERPAQASDALISAATTMRYAVATTSSLFDAVVAALNGDDDAVRAYTSRLVSADGYLA